MLFPMFTSEPLAIVRSDTNFSYVEIYLIPNLKYLRAQIVELFSAEMLTQYFRLTCKQHSGKNIGQF